MLFRKNIDPRCAYCAKGSRINDEQVVCVKRGVVPASDHCGAFSYDPLASGGFGRGNILDFWWVGMMAWDGFLCRVVGRNFPLRIIISHTSTP